MKISHGSTVPVNSILLSLETELTWFLKMQTTKNIFATAKGGFYYKAAEGVREFLLQLHRSSGNNGRWKYNQGMDRPHALISTGLAMEQLVMIDGVEGIDCSIREASLEYMVGCQDSDGFFKDPLVAESELVEGHCFNWIDLWSHMNVFGAIQALGGELRFPIPEKVHNQSCDNDQWLIDGDWTNPWLMGARFSATVKGALSHSSFGTSLADEKNNRVARWFDFLESRVLSPDSGYPEQAGCLEKDVAMAGLFKILMGYLAADKSYPYIEAAIDSTLNLQETEGDFARRDSLRLPPPRTYVTRYAKDMCINWDAIWILRMLDRMASGLYRHKEIVDSGIALADCLLRDYRKSDGGFAFAGDHCLMVHGGVWISEALPEGDLLGTHFCLECLRYADEWSGNENI